MKKRITLSLFLQMGGDISKIDLSKTEISYSECFELIPTKLEVIDKDKILCTFSDGFIFEANPNWILTDVLLTLSQEFNTAPEQVVSDDLCYQINSAIQSCEGRISTGGDIDKCFAWLNEELQEIYNGKVIYEIN